MLKINAGEGSFTPENGQCQIGLLFTSLQKVGLLTAIYVTAGNLLKGHP